MNTKQEFDFTRPYRVKGWEGIAFHAIGYATDRIYNADWGEVEEVEDRDHVVVVMIGDDRKWTVDPADCTPLTDDEYCGGCGQIGCHWC